jgi:hypothetical protein
MVKKAENQINSNTQIIFTVKGFFALLGTMLLLFYGFYLVVVLPRINKTEEHYDKMYVEQKQQNMVFYGELREINVSIGSLSTKIETLHSMGNNNEARVSSDRCDGLYNQEIINKSDSLNSIGFFKLNKHYLAEKE